MAPAGHWPEQEVPPNPSLATTPRDALHPLHLPVPFPASPHAVGLLPTIFPLIPYVPLALEGPPSLQCRPPSDGQIISNFWGLEGRSGQYASLLCTFSSSTGLPEGSVLLPTPFSASRTPTSLPRPRHPHTTPCSPTSWPSDSSCLLSWAHLHYILGADYRLCPGVSSP